MEKSKPTFPLNVVKSLIAEGKCKVVGTAKQNAHSLGFSETEVKDVVAALEPKDFYKSMTDNFNSKSWQDVYKKRIRNHHLYIKFKVFRVGDEEVLILSFKEDESQ